MVCDCWAKTEPALRATRATIAIRARREMRVRFVFTGLEPSGEQKYWCGPSFGFTGRISPPSLLKICCCIKARKE